MDPKAQMAKFRSKGNILALSHFGLHLELTHFQFVTSCEL
jgi:hypothetical protein